MYGELRYVDYYERIRKVRIENGNLLFVDDNRDYRAVLPSHLAEPGLPKDVARCVYFRLKSRNGNELTFIGVADEDHVEYDGRIYKLSPFVGTFMPEDKRNTSGAYQGAKYFAYKGEVLDDLRTKIEHSNEK